MNYELFYVQPEKARLQAAAEAAENARRRAEAEAALEAKRKRDLEREAARQALLKVLETYPDEINIMKVNSWSNMFSLYSLCYETIIKGDSSTYQPNHLLPLK